MLHAKKYGIDSLGLWKMFDNLRRSLLVPASLALLVWLVFTDAMALSKAVALVLAAFLAGPLLGALAGLPWRVSLVGALGLALSSTAIALQSLAERNLMRTQSGQAGFSILLFQDVAAIPILALLPVPLVYMPRGAILCT